MLSLMAVIFWTNTSSLEIPFGVSVPSPNNDPKMIEETKYWIEGVFASRQPDGYFGPVNERNGKRELWAQMIMLWCLQSYYE